MARRKCYYMLIIVCPYLFMVLLFYREIQESENHRKVSLEQSALIYSQSSEVKVTDVSTIYRERGLNSDFTPNPSTRRSVLVDKHVNKNPKSSFKKPELSKLNIQVKPAVNKKAQSSNENLSFKSKHTKGDKLPNQNIGDKKVNEDDNILLGGKPKISGHKNTSTTPRYQVPKPVINKKRSCLDMDSPVDKINYGFQNLSNLHIFSVFYDNRDEHPKIRLIVLKNRTDDGPLLCGFGKKGHLYIVLSEQYEMCENHDKKFGGWIYTCQLPSQIKNVPCHVYISHSVDGFRKKHTGTMLKMNITMSTTNLETSSPKKDFGICVPPIFGEVSIISLVQFVELSKILGANGITFYQTYTSPPDVEKVLQYYKNKGEITVVPWILPGNLTEQSLWYYGQILAVEDCLYRNMARYKYLAFNDLDEFIVPKNYTNWSDMIKEISSKSIQPNLTEDEIAGFSFKSAFFSPNQPIDGSYKVKFLQLLYRTKTFSSIRNKLIVKSEKIFELGIHHVSRPITEAVTISVDPSLAFVHHYRGCSVDYDSGMKCLPVVEDLTLLRYATELTTNYLSSMDGIISLIYDMSEQ